MYQYVLYCIALMADSAVKENWSLDRENSTIGKSRGFIFILKVIIEFSHANKFANIYKLIQTY